jgi:NADPH-dependent 2,4-dienoyl-CoA reductase/sulfur reductase-like enzyme
MPEFDFQFEIVVAGAGPAGLAAATSAAHSGKRVALMDETSWLGGQIWRSQKGRPTSPQARQWIEKFKLSGATLLDRTSVIGAPQPGVLLAEHPDGPREIRWKKLILATGARELFLPFPGWTLPGILGPGGLQSMAKSGWPVRNKRIVIAGAGPLLVAVAEGLRKHGAIIPIVAEQAPLGRVAGFGAGLLSYPEKLFEGVGLFSRLMGIPYRFGVWPVLADGREQIESVTLTNGRKTWTEHCDYLACGFGLVPNIELPLLLGCELSDGFAKVDPWQCSSMSGVYCAGELTGIGGASCALVEGQIAGYAAADRTEQAEVLFSQRNSWHRFRSALADAFALRPELKSLAADETILCRCEDVALGRVKMFNNWREAKLQTRCGMGACQGRVCGAAAKFLLGWGMESVRLPILPARVSSLIQKQPSH